MCVNPAFLTVLSAEADTRRGLFAATAQRLGTSERNAEKDFWVCLTLDVLFNGLPPGGPRLLFKGGTSLSKAHALIARFSEDIDVTVFRNDLGQAGTAEELAALSGKQRGLRLDAIRDACRAYINGPLLAELTSVFGGLLAEAGHPAVDIVPDPEDPSGQGLQIRYDSVTADAGDGYIRPIVRIESGAKSALDPNAPQVIRPYVEADLPDVDFAIPNVVTVDASRTFWDKVVILHGLRRWFDRRGELRVSGSRATTTTSIASWTRLFAPRRPTRRLEPIACCMRACSSTGPTSTWPRRGQAASPSCRPAKCSSGFAGTMPRWPA